MTSRVAKAIRRASMLEAIRRAGDPIRRAAGAGPTNVEQTRRNMLARWKRADHRTRGRLRREWGL